MATARANDGPTQPNEQPPWHHLDAAHALSVLETTAEGLSTAEAAGRLATVGPNRLPAAPGRSAWRRFLAQFNSVLIYGLIVAAAISAALGHWVDAGVVLGVVVANAIISFVQEGRAERALEAIRGMIDPKATVLRDARRMSIAAEEIVPGDIVLLEAGARVPADLRMLKARGLKIDEAALTGESVAVDKLAHAVALDAALAERRSMAFSGTFVAAGQGTGVAVGTGSHTELGRISALLDAVELLETPLTRQMAGFARRLAVGIFGLAVVVFVLAYWVRDYALADAFMTVVGLAVAAMPEELPAILTIALAIGVRRMAQRHAIVRHLPAVETLGSVSVICSDKTGTLTRNEMTVRSVVTASGESEVSGGGYAPEGSFRRHGHPLDPARDKTLGELARAGLLCNDADVRQTAGRWVADGDPMEAALVTLAMKAGVDPALTRKQVPRTDEIPFDAQHRFMATLHHTHAGEAFILIKGAPERILSMCATVRNASGDQALDAPAWHKAASKLASRGERVLGFAVKTARAGQRDLDFADVDSNATLLGLVGFLDPPRDEAVAAVAECRTAGIRVVMITGDHADTAREIARQLGLADDPKVVSGRALDGLDTAGLARIASEADVFARTTPEHKLRLVEALQASGMVVAMTGDGVNDAPALKRADVGVAMGGKGTEVAKEAAQIVLADDNFASIAAAVREGRTVYDNLMKVIAFALPTNAGEAMTIVAAIAFGLALPITPVQILWVNMVTTVALGLVLAFEPTEPGVMRRPPRPSGRPILTGSLIWRILYVSLLFVVGAFSVYFWAEASGRSTETARTMVVNTLVAMEIFYLFSVRYAHGTSLTWHGFLGTPSVIGGVAATVLCQVAFTYLPPFQFLFGTTALSVGDGAIVVGIGLALLVLAEAEKAIRRRIAASES